jgi:hypothetical protein
MISYESELNAQLQEIENLIVEEEKRIKLYKNLEPGRLRVTESHGCPQYLFRKDGTTKEQYIPTYEKDKIRLLAQRDYDEKTYKLLNDMKKRLAKFLDGYDPEMLDHIYNRMCQGRKNIVVPIMLTDEMYIEKWMEKYKGGMNTFGEATEFKSQRGEFVRSKSEKIIADYFYTHNIPYQCEPTFTVANNKNVFPDFAILNVRKRKTIYWEHLGKVGEEVYATRNFNKLMDYEEQGLIIGDNLIITMETEKRSLDIAIVEEKVRLFLL